MRADAQVTIRCECKTVDMTYGAFCGGMPRVHGYLVSVPLQCPECLDVAIVEVKDVYDDEKDAPGNVRGDDYEVVQASSDAGYKAINQGTLAG